MGRLTRFVATALTGVAAASVTMVAVGTGTAVADGATAQGGKMVPLSPLLRRCDWSSVGNVPSDTKGTMYALVSRTGSTVTAEIHVLAATPDIFYGVRLVEVPRTGISCNPSDPGVGMTRVYTDWAGNGVATVSAPVMRGATGAWVSVEGPLGESTMLSGDFRTSDFVAAI